MKRAPIVALILVAILGLGLVACGQNPAAASDITFSADTLNVPVGGTVSFRWSSTAKSACWIEPLIGSVPCSGSKVWVFPAAGQYTFVLHTPAADSQAVLILVK